MTPPIYDVSHEIKHRCNSIEDLIDSREGSWMLSPQTAFPGHFEEPFIPDDSSIDIGYFWMPPEILEVNVYKLSDTIYTPKACLYKDSYPVGGSNLFTLSALSDAQSSIGDVLQAPELMHSGFLILHANYTTYGHFLLEMIPKIVAYKALLARLPGLKLVLPGIVPAFVLKWLHLFVSDELIAFAPADRNAQIGDTYISDMLSTHYAFSDCLKSFLTLCLESTTSEPRVHETEQVSPSNIFLSRSTRRTERSDYRVLENEHLIATRMNDLGLTVVSPEDLPLEQQIQMFRSARVVVGELSSALHNCIFSTAGALVVQLNPFNPVQRRIAASLDQRLISILSDDNMLYGWPQPVTARFTVSPERIERALSLVSSC